jgi:drug/metabolite transporter (DMT)-like permease
MTAILLFSITANQGFYLLGLYHLSPTYASAIQNTVPAITFVMAAVLRCHASTSSLSLHCSTAPNTKQTI